MHDDVDIESIIFFSRSAGMPNCSLTFLCHLRQLYKQPAEHSKYLYLPFALPWANFTERTIYRNSLHTRKPETPKEWFAIWLENPNWSKSSWASMSIVDDLRLLKTLRSFLTFNKLSDWWWWDFFLIKILLTSLDSQWFSKKSLEFCFVFFLNWKIRSYHKEMSSNLFYKAVFGVVTLSECYLIIKYVTSCSGSKYSQTT